MRGELLIVFITPGRAHSARPPPLAGLEELRSEHFRPRTDLPPAAARVALARLEPDPAARLALAEAAAREYPDSQEAAVFLAATLRDDPAERPSRADAAARALRLAPEDPDSLSAAAVEEARTGRVAAALQAIARAVNLAPWSPVVLRVQANLLAAAGRCDEALDSARRAENVLPHRAPAELVAAVHRDLDLIRRSCSRARAH